MKNSRWLAMAAVLALAGCARFELPSIDTTKFDPRLAQDAYGRVVNAAGEPVHARLYYQDNANEVVVSGADGRFRFPLIRKTYSEVARIDSMPVRWLVVEAKGYKQGLQKVDLGAPAELLIRLEPGQ
jgi:hypothetical protein